ncbi:hypothetical protein [Daejeonella lutea]|uniref:Uncharacterized protein n=1 Tax=Daejeonella lutea TaxID=572036 RepID=A0A1T5EYI8_9SPHI|nr:hypothetical protein [Daejeonella lutea]SKB88986.1 hypothetical protein SAMN05661099_3297 [Daejeonella lutea]
MTAKNYTGLLGVILVLVGGMCPMLRVPIFGNWNYWDIDTVLASIVYSLSALALIAAVTRKQGLLRFSGWLLLLMLVFTLTAVYFKANDYFSFIPLKKLAAAATRMIKFKWIGWGLMFAGTFIIILFSGKEKVSLKTSPKMPG